MLTIKRIINFLLLLLILRFFLEKQIEKCKNNVPIPNFINFFVNEISYWFTRPLNIFIKKIYKEKKEWTNTICCFFSINLFVLYYYGYYLRYNIYLITTISTLIFIKYFLDIMSFIMILEIIINFLKPFSNLNYFIYLINFNILKKIQIFNNTTTILGVNINLLIYFILIKIINYFLNKFIATNIYNV
ncbi:hypothetical protein [Candidatus Zinderia endosymbiont of Aphrophora alni]|uniref:hypothetical protein n=1 Tax=Candidatus Zinderia endosymbiont of Aphrophora alni TaxID=3077951 RepID=UPI0030CB720D